jgi:hypothetical protein
VGYGYCAAQVNVYNAAMQTTLELLEKTPESLIAAGVRSAFVPRNRAVIAADCRSEPVTRVLEPAREPALDAACGATGCSRRVQQADRPRGSAARNTGNNSGSRRAAGRCGRSRRACSRSILEGVSGERARCLRGIPIPEIPFAAWVRMADSVRMAKLPACRFGFFLSFEAHDFAANLGRYG